MVVWMCVVKAVTRVQYLVRESLKFSRNNDRTGRDPAFIIQGRWRGGKGVLVGLGKALVEG
jgi:hypothetical protein